MKQLSTRQKNENKANNKKSINETPPLEAAHQQLQQLRTRGDQAGERRLLAEVSREHGAAAARDLQRNTPAQPAAPTPRAADSAGTRGIPPELLDPQAPPGFRGVGPRARGLPPVPLDHPAAPTPRAGADAGATHLPPELIRPQAAPQPSPAANDHPIKLAPPGDHPIQLGSDAKAAPSPPAAAAPAPAKATPPLQQGAAPANAPTTATPQPQPQPQPEAVVPARAAEATTHANNPKAQGRGAGAKAKAGATAAKGEGAATAAPARDAGAKTEAGGAAAGARGGAATSSAKGGVAGTKAADAAAATQEAIPEAGCEHHQGGMAEAEQAVREASKRLDILLGSDPVVVVKTALSIANIFPGIGLVSGIAEKGIEFFQSASKLISIQGDGSSTHTFQQLGGTALLGGRGLVGVLQVCVDQISQMEQWINLGLVLGGVTAPVGLLGGVTNEALTGASLSLNMIGTAMDVGLLALSKQIRTNATPEDAARLGELEDGFESSIVGDTLAILFDIYDGASAGFAQGRTVKPVANVIVDMFDGSVKTISSIKNVHKLVVKLDPFKKPALKNVVLSQKSRVVTKVWSNRGAVDVVAGEAEVAEHLEGGMEASKAGEQPCSAHAAAEAPSFTSLLEGLHGLRGGHQKGTELVDWLLSSANDLVETCNEGVGELLGMKDPVGSLRDFGAKTISRMGSELEGMHAAGGVIGDASAKVAEGQAQLVGVRAMVAGLRVPEIPEPQASDFGDNLLADLAEGVVDSGLEKARAVAQQAREQLTALVEGVKIQAQEQLETLEAGAAELQSFLDTYQETLNEQIGKVQARMQSIAEKLAGCEQFEDYLNLLLEQIGEFMGIPGGLGIDALKGRWEEVGTLLDEAIAHVEELEAEAATKEGEEEEEGEAG